MNTKRAIKKTKVPVKNWPVIEYCDLPGDYGDLFVDFFTTHEYANVINYGFNRFYFDKTGNVSYEGEYKKAHQKLAKFIKKTFKENGMKIPKDRYAQVLIWMNW